MPTPPVPGPDSEMARGFLMYVGYCITTWADVEEQLFQVCWKALQAPKEQAAIVYYCSPTVDSRLRLTTDLVNSVLPKRKRKSGGHDDPDVKKWKDIARRVRDLLQTRNRIAHDPVTQNWAPPIPGRATGYTWYEICLSEAENLSGAPGKVTPLSVGDLQHHLIMTLALIAPLRAFHQEILPKHIR